MSDKSVYAWYGKHTPKGMQLGGMVKGEHISEDLLSLGRPLKEAIAKWQTFIGVQKAEKGLHSQADFNLEVPRTLKWAQNPYPIKCICYVDKEKLETWDTPQLMNPGSMTCSEKVVGIFQKLCPGEFEAYPLIVETQTGISTKYFLINITHIINPAIDREKCIYTTLSDRVIGKEDAIAGGGFKRLLLIKGCMKEKQLGRMYDQLSREMIAKPVIEAFQREKVTGFTYIPLEDDINKLYKSNRLPNGKLVGYEDA